MTGDLRGKTGYLPGDSGEAMIISATCPREICNVSSVIQMGATGAAKPWKATRDAGNLRGGKSDGLRRWFGPIGKVRHFCLTSETLFRQLCFPMLRTFLAGLIVEELVSRASLFLRIRREQWLS